MDVHVEIIKLIIAYALTGSFLFTLVVTCLSLINVIKSIDKKLKRKLINVLIVQVAVIAVGSFSDVLNLDPGETSNTIREDERTEIASDLIESIAPAGNISNLQITSPQSKAKVLNTLTMVKKISPEKVGSEADSLINYLNRTPANLRTAADSANFAKDIGSRLSRIKIGLRPQESTRR